MMAQEATLEEIANRKLRRLLAFNMSLTCADVELGDTALFCRAQRKKSAPRWRGPAFISDIDETGVTVKFQSQTSRCRGSAKEKKGRRKLWRILN